MLSAKIEAIGAVLGGGALRARPYYPAAETGGGYRCAGGLHVNQWRNPRIQRSKAMHWNWNDDWSGWNWALMMIGMIAFWGLVAWAIVALVRSPNRSERGNDSAEQILAERLAAGEIEGNEYQHRLDLLRSARVRAGK